MESLTPVKTPSSAEETGTSTAPSISAMRSLFCPHSLVASDCPNASMPVTPMTMAPSILETRSLPCPSSSPPVLRCPRPALRHADQTRLQMVLIAEQLSAAPEDGIHLKKGECPAGHSPFFVSMKTTSKFKWPIRGTGRFHRGQYPQKFLNHHPRYQ